MAKFAGILKTVIQRLVSACKCFGQDAVVTRCHLIKQDFIQHKCENNVDSFLPFSKQEHISAYILYSAETITFDFYCVIKDLGTFSKCPQIYIKLYRVLR